MDSTTWSLRAAAVDQSALISVASDITNSLLSFQTISFLYIPIVTQKKKKTTVNPPEARNVGYNKDNKPEFSNVCCLCRYRSGPRCCWLVGWLVGLVWFGWLAINEITTSNGA